MILVKIVIFLFGINLSLMASVPPAEKPITPIEHDRKLDETRRIQITKKFLSKYLIVPLLIPLKTNITAKQQEQQIQNQQWFLANYFPIVIKDPLRELANAISGIVQYGPNASLVSANCRVAKSSTSGNNHLDLSDAFIVNLPTSSAKKIDKKSIHNRLVTRRQSVHNDVNDDDDNALDSNNALELDISEKLFAQNDKMKNWHRENSGNGIFIHRIKVRQGGVAIAGPNGIATAGSGGTAIVGPNGWALTQPNGMALAGPGTNVVALDSNVNLEQVAREIHKLNGSLPRNIRGKVVARGPILYYNNNSNNRNNNNNRY